MMIAFPCTTGSVSRMFKLDGPDPGPPAPRSAAHPDGLPDDQLPKQYRRELKNSNKLLNRAVNLAIAAHRSPAKTTIIFENPADRSAGSPGMFDEEFEDHGSIFKTKPFLRLLANVTMSPATFAMCRFNDGDIQKYTTVYYTNDASPPHLGLQGEAGRYL